MSNVNIWLRKKQKLLLAILCSFLIIAWVGGGAIWHAFDRSPIPDGTVFGDTVSGREIIAKARRLSAFSGRQRITESELLARTWELIIMEKEAERHGIRVGEAELLRHLQERFPAASGGGLDEIAYAAHLQEVSMSRASYEIVLKDLLAKMLLYESIESSVIMPKEEAWLWHSREEEQIQTRYLQLRASDLAPFVAVTEEEIRKFYDTYAREFADVNTGRPGYKESEKVKIEYVMATYEKYANEAEIEPAQIDKYYNEHKDEFVITKEKTKEDPKKSPDKDEASPGDEDKKKTEEAPSHKPLAEVKDEIIKKLRDEEGKRKAEAVMNTVWDEILEMLDTSFGSDKTIVCDMLKLREKHNLFYHKTEYFMASQVNEVVPGGFALANRAFEQGALGRGDPKLPIKVDDGVLIFQIVDSIPPQPAKYEEAKEQVERDLRLAKAFDLAKEIVWEAAAAPNMDAATEKVKARLAASVNPAGDQDKEPDIARLFATDKTPFFSQSREYRSFDGSRLRYHYNTGLPGRFNYCRYADAAFKLGKGELGAIAEPIPQRAAFVLERAATKPASREEFEKNLEQALPPLLAKKKGAVLETWHAGLRRRANPSADVMKFLRLLPDWQEHAGLADQ